MEPKLKETIVSYGDTVKEYKKNTLNLQKKRELNKFLSFLPKKSKILECGCAFGRDTKTFVEKDFDVIGIDLSENMIKEAKRYYPKGKYKLMDIQDLKFKDKSFDGVYCVATIIHLTKKDAKKALTEMKRVLKDNGILYLTFKKGKGEEFKEDKRYAKRVKKFFAYYSENEVKKVISKAGLKIIELTTFKKRSKYSAHPWIGVYCLKNK